MAKAKRAASADQLPIASAVRARRRRLGLTLQELADKSGLSAPFLSQVERSQTTPSITSLIAKRAFEEASVLANTTREEDLDRAAAACQGLHDALLSLTR